MSKLKKYKQKEYENVEAIQLCWANLAEVCKWLGIKGDNDDIRLVTTFIDDCGEEGPWYLRISGIVSRCVKHGEFIVKNPYDYHYRFSVYTPEKFRELVGAGLDEILS